MAEKRRTSTRRKPQAPKQCYFCSEQKTPAYTDTSVLQRFLTERGKIIARSRTGICAKHQRQLSDNIKYARHLALLPFVARE